MNRATAFTESLSLRFPIFQAPVGSVASEPGGRDILRYDAAPPPATMLGNPAAMCLFAGTSCDDVHEIFSAHELMQELWRDCRSAVQSVHLHP